MVISAMSCVVRKLNLPFNYKNKKGDFNGLLPNFPDFVDAVDADYDGYYD